MFYLLLVVPFLFCFLARFIAVVSFVLYMILAPFSPLIPPTRFAFCLYLFVYFCYCCLYLFCLLNQSRNKGEGWSTANLFKPPSNFIADRLKAALLFWFFSDFKCGVPLFIIILVVFKYKK